MTLQEFRSLTDGMPPSTLIHTLSPWGEFEPAALITIEDLVPSDPARVDFPVGGIVIAGDADLTHRAALPTTPQS